jgi:hypothetical protein
LPDLQIIRVLNRAIHRCADGRSRKVELCFVDRCLRLRDLRLLTGRDRCMRVGGSSPRIGDLLLGRFTSLSASS